MAVTVEQGGSINSEDESMAMIYIYYNYNMASSSHNQTIRTRSEPEY